MPIDVAATDLDLVRSILERTIPDRDVLVTGSRVTGRAKPFSDLDLVVLGDAALDLSVLARLRDAFDESGLPFSVDIVEWATASVEFRRAIHRHAQPLPAASASRHARPSSSSSGPGDSG